MKIMKLIYFTLLALLAVSCDSFLDETPDNRAEVDSQVKIRKLLVSAYSTGNYALACELSTDNIDDSGSSNPNSIRLYEQMANWEDVTETDNDDLKTVWEEAYLAIAHSNQALAAIEELGEEDLLAEKGEALITRAYSHFILVNVFCKHFNAQTSSSDLGIPYIEEPETTLNPQYQRGTVQEVYEKIDADIEAALPLISDDMYEVAAYHFTQKTAYAFAARFNLFYEKWQKAEDYATAVLTSNPLSQLRDWVALGSLPRDPSVVSNGFINSPANLLSVTSGSNQGLVFGAYYYGSRFNHSRKVADEQTLFAPMPWSPASVARSAFNFGPFVYAGTNLDKTLFYKIPYMFEYTDPIAGIGYRHTVSIPFSSDETILIRAEAEIMQNKYEAAIADLNIWSKNFYKDVETTVDEVNAFYAAIAYSSELQPTQKKHLNPAFSIEAGVQENMLHYLLQCRRVLTLHEGLRWFDIKRYGIEVPRFQIQSNGTTKVLDVLTINDPRRALQIPADVVTAGIEANPR